MNLMKGLKVHLRVYQIYGKTLRIVTLRPQTKARMSTNYFHETWHLLAGPYGAAVLGRLMYGLAFQQQPGTLVMLDAPHLVPTPFEADPTEPVLLVPDGLTSVDLDTLRALKLRLRRAPVAPTTIRWHTFGMPADLARDRYRVEPWEANERRERMTRRAGFICYTAPPAILKSTGLGIFGMQDATDGSYLPMANTNRMWWTMEGEFQLIANFEDDVGAAAVARHDVLGEHRATITDDERSAIWRRKDAVMSHRNKARG